MTFLRFLMLLALASWAGGLIFFSFVAQSAFSALPSTHLAGLVVGSSLRALHWIGFVSGITFLIASFLYNHTARGTYGAFSLSHILVIAMLGLTAVSHFQIIPRMDAIRASAGEISTLPAGSELRMQFDSLHRWSTRTEGAVLLLALIVLYSTARRFSPHSA